MKWEVGWAHPGHQRKVNRPPASGAQALGPGGAVCSRHLQMERLQERTLGHMA